MDDYNRYGSYINKGYSLSEAQTLQIFEDLHFAAYQYNDALNILTYLIEYIFCCFAKKTYYINAAKINTYPLSIADNVYIIVKYSTSTNYIHGGYTRISDKELHITIVINPNVKVGQLDLNVVRECLDHEILHAVRDQHKLDSGRPSEYEESLKHIRYDDPKYQSRLDKALSVGQCSPEYIIYHLFTDNELYALVNQLPRNLKSIDAKERSRYVDDVKKTTVYRDYRFMSDYLKTLETTDDWVNPTKQYFVKFDTMNNKLFKDFFITQCNKRLELMWREMSKIASVYYIDADAAAGTWTELQKRLMIMDKNDKMSTLIKQNILFDKSNVRQIDKTIIVEVDTPKPKYYSVAIYYNQYKQLAEFEFLGKLMREWTINIH